MPGRKISLKEILNKFAKEECNEGHWDFTDESIFVAMKEACRQVLELAAKRAVVKGSMGLALIDRESITDTINEVE